MSESSRIAKLLVKSVATGEISAIKPDLDTQGIRLVGVGLEQLGLEEFQKGNFFQGELYLDEKKESYQKLGFKRFSLMGVLASLLGRASRTLIAQARADKTIGGDMKGDGLQNGGVLVVAKGGEVLLSFKQVSPADHVENCEILKALGLAQSLSPVDSDSQKGDAV